MSEQPYTYTGWKAAAIITGFFGVIALVAGVIVTLVWSWIG